MVAVEPEHIDPDHLDGRTGRGVVRAVPGSAVAVVIADAVLQAGAPDHHLVRITVAAALELFLGENFPHVDIVAKGRSRSDDRRA